MERRANNASDLGASRISDLSQQFLFCNYFFNEYVFDPNIYEIIC